jgi:hypothetical protein
MAKMLNIYYNKKLLLLKCLIVLPLKLKKMVAYSYEYYNNKSGNTVARKCRTDTDRKKKVASVASLNQLVQYEKKKS